jgi:hypothetical protein
MDEYKNIESFQLCYGCKFSITGKEALNPVTIAAETSQSGDKKYQSFLAHNNEKCILKARERICAELGAQGTNILENLIVNMPKKSATQ